MNVDANSNTIRLVDDNGGTRGWAYDLQDSQTTMTFHDGSTRHYDYDPASDVTGYTAENGSGRLIGKRHLKPDFSTLVGFTAAYDPSSNKLYERALHAESRSSLYAMDSMDRLIQYQRGLRNWSNTGSTPEGGSPELELRTHNKLNQIVAFGVAPTSTPITYDTGNNVAPNAKRGNGNFANDGTRIYLWDALNRLVQVSRVSDAAVIGAYRYDALSTRISRAVSNGGITDDLPDSFSRYLLAGQQIVEELDDAGDSVIQYAYGQYIDEPVQLNSLTAIGPQPLSAGKYYLLSDLLYRSAALTDASGAIVETYDTDAYGKTIPFSGPGADSTWFTDDDTQATSSACRYIFTGREWDAETGLYFYRARYYLPALGRFVGRDPILYTGGIGLYWYCNANPARRADPSGMYCWNCLAVPLEFVLFHAALLGVIDACPAAETPQTFIGCEGAIAIALGAGIAYFFSLAECIDCLSDDPCPASQAKLKEMSKKYDDANRQVYELQNELDELKKKYGSAPTPTPPPPTPAPAPPQPATAPPTTAPAAAASPPPPPPAAAPADWPNKPLSPDADPAIFAPNPWYPVTGIR